ncbi:glycosyltransferase family 4 protein [Arthrobacter zhaoguopingii]|uniref:glycosyltransferase family 4 protein n=1 Tax=Arthrobacter zhaoguopingii TaxID=2681491 RepID=UPI00135CD2F9|nr:glycosyltransferase family 4 protein [Arthrobacter zhaoguopingii]
MPPADGTDPTARPAGTTASDLKVVHVNDCAFYAQRILAKASEQELPWSFYPRAVAGYPLTGLNGRARYALDGAAWLGGLARRAVSSDLLHIHSGGVTQHTRFIPKTYVLTLHGTDIRTLQYDERWRNTILRGVRNAAAVMYTTPDLREHILPHRPDAVYLPVSIDLTKLPPPVPREQGRARVFFVSRWDDSKNAAGQLETARQLVLRSGGTFDVYGLDWGPMAGEAEKAGVKLVPRMSHSDYLDFLNASNIAVGQAAGILAASELEAMALGVPLYISLTPGLYPDDIPVGREPAESPAAMAELIATELKDQDVLERRGAQGRQWIAEHHDPARAVEVLREIYAAASR